MHSDCLTEPKFDAKTALELGLFERLKVRLWRGRLPSSSSEWQWYKLFTSLYLTMMKVSNGAIIKGSISHRAAPYFLLDRFTMSKLEYRPSKPFHN